MFENEGTKSRLVGLRFFTANDLNHRERTCQWAHHRCELPISGMSCLHDHGVAIPAVRVNDQYRFGKEAFPGSVLRSWQ